MKKKLLILLLGLLGLLLLTGLAAANLHARLQEHTALIRLAAALERTDCTTQRQLAWQYNQTKDPGQYHQALNITEGMMGSLEIPKIRVQLPIYHGCSEAVLEKGVGHLPDSDLPLGETGSHTVLTGHTGLPGAALLTDLDKLKEGDCFLLQVLGQELIYQVYNISVVTPEDTSALKAHPEGDLCTLVTCTPYGINSHRLLIQGRRVARLPESASLTGASATVLLLLRGLLMVAFAGPLGFSGVFWICLQRRRLGRPA